MSQETSDRRKHQRRIHERFSAKKDWTVSLDTLGKGEIENISSGGMFLRSDKLIPVNSIIRIDFMPPEKEGEKTSVDAKVIWTRKDRKGNFVGMGVEFLEHPKRDDKIISYYVDAIRSISGEQN